MIEGIKLVFVDIERIDRYYIRYERSYIEVSGNTCYYYFVFFKHKEGGLCHEIHL
jgi:hypothetical protein